MNRGAACCYTPYNDYKFLYTIIDNFKKLLMTVPFGKFGGSLYSTLDFKGTALKAENVLLSLDGLISYLYFKAYDTPFPKNPTKLDIQKLYTVYDALKLPRPVII